jgi:hypothetical protein
LPRTALDRLEPRSIASKPRSIASNHVVDRFEPRRRHRDFPEAMFSDFDTRRRTGDNEHMLEGHGSGCAKEPRGDFAATPFSEQILLSRQQQPDPRNDDHERITRARQAAEALFTSKPPVSGPSVPNSAPANQPTRKPRVLQIISQPAAPSHHGEVKPPVSREPQTTRAMEVARVLRET